MADQVAAYLSDNVVEVVGLVDPAGAYVNSATVEVTLLDSAGAQVAGETWPVACAYVAGSDGVYRGPLRDALTVSPRRRYHAIVTADAGADLRRRWRLPVLFSED